MAIVAGVDFGTLSVRVSLVDSERGLLESAISEYPLHRKREDPEYATQSHDDHMRALASATRAALKKAGALLERARRVLLVRNGDTSAPFAISESISRRVKPFSRELARSARDLSPCLVLSNVPLPMRRAIYRVYLLTAWSTTGESLSPRQNVAASSGTGTLTVRPSDNVAAELAARRHPCRFGRHHAKVGNSVARWCNLCNSPGSLSAEIST